MRDQNLKKSMISGLSDPWNPVLIHFTLPKYFKKYMKNHGDLLETYFPYLRLGNQKKWHLLKRRAPENPEDPFNKMSQIMDMRAISIIKHELFVANMVPRSTTKH